MMSDVSVAFRKVVESRRSCKRFEVGSVIPEETVQDLLEMTIVGARNYRICLMHASL